VSYSEQRLKVGRTARWGLIGDLSLATREVWVALHGYAQLAAEFAALARWPVSSARAFVFPEALQRFYAANTSEPLTNRTAPVVASWMTRDARDDDIADNHAYLDALWSAVRARAPNADLVAFGFSQGGATAARWSAARAAAGVPPAWLILWGSGVPEEVDLTTNAPLRAVPVTFVVGDRDPWVTPKRVAAERARFATAGFPVDVRVYAGGHRLDNDVLVALAAARDVPTPGL
jgi:predicted esterase